MWEVWAAVPPILPTKFPLTRTDFQGKQKTAGHLEYNLPMIDATSDLYRPLTEAVQQALVKTTNPGVCAAILVDGQPFFSAAAGTTDPAGSTALDEQAQFLIYSATKTLIAAVVLQLAENGILALDSPVQAVLPDLALKIPVTLRQLLNHTGGIPDYGGMPAYSQAVRESPNKPWSSAEFLEATIPGGLAFASGQGWGYSNIGYLLLRQVIESVTNKPLRSVLDELIFVPLGVRSTFTAENLEQTQQLTPGWSKFLSQDRSLEDIRSRYHPGWVSHGVVASTALELTKIFDAVLAGPLLSQASRQSMLEGVDVPVKHPFFQQPAYGLGIMIDRASAYGLMAGHGGGGPGYSAGVLHLPNASGRRITGAALVNGDEGDLGMELAYILTQLTAGASSY
jgi:D-alanyl-D-alanine carboxypeptidase